jgi:hypothetical protein
MDLLIQKVADRMGEKRGAGHNGPGLLPCVCNHKQPGVIIF